jgi:hypothetical protein
MTARSIVAGSLIATMSVITVSVPAMSAPLTPGLTNSGPIAPAQQVQYRRWHHHHHGWHGHGGGDAGALIGGLAAGAIIGGAIAAGQAQQQNAAYCSRRFRSYDPQSGTYLGNDGRRHPCP